MMDPRCKEELARAYVRAIELASESAKRNGFVYAKGLSWACHEAAQDPDVEELIYSMIASGHVDFTDWAKKILEPAESAGQKDDHPGNNPE